MSNETEVTCLECGTLCGAPPRKDTYKHLVTCLQMEPNPLDRARDAAEADRNERGRRIVHLIDALTSPAVAAYDGGN